MIYLNERKLNDVDIKNKNKIYKSNGYGNFKIIKDLGMINKVHYVIIKFINTGFENKVALSQVKYGTVRDKSTMRDNDNVNPNIMHNSNYGSYRIIKTVGKNNNGDRLVLIRFEITKTEKIYLLQDALNGSVRDEKYSDLDFNIEYNSYNSGKFKIIEYLGNKLYKIKFINTGSILTVRKDHILDGHIKDPALLKTVKIGEIYNTNKYGKIIIKCIINNEYAAIEFMNTGYIKNARIDHILSGNVRDDTIPSVYGIANYGTVNESYDNIRKFYNIWIGMISRCYNINSKAYNSYGAKGVKVCDRWLTFENFLEDIKYLMNYNELVKNPNMYELDKDYLQQHIPISNRIYSPETCVFILKSDNLKIASLNRNNIYFKENINHDPSKQIICNVVK